MSIASLARRAGKVTADNAPAILTAIGVTGAITTAVLAGKASFKAAQVLEEAERDGTLPYLEGGEVRARREDLTLKEKAELTWKLYVPAVGTATLTVAAIVMSNRISTRRAAALASAYTVSQEFFKEYKKSVVDTIGKDKEKKIREDVAKKIVEKSPPPAGPMIVIGGKDCWVHDEFTDRWFKSSYEALEQAAIDINFQIINDGSATLSDFFKLLGVTHAAIYEEVGWNRTAKLELSIGGTVTEDKVPALTLDFLTVPVREYSSSY